MHTNKNNNKKYIGITRNSPKRRWSNGNGYKSEYFCNAIKKYGWDNFKHEIIFCNLTKEQAECLEIEMIKYHRTTDRNYGYNIQNGGNTKGSHSDETKQKISKIHKGKIISEETKERIRKKVKCIQNNTIYNSIKEASKALNIKENCISRNCLGKSEFAKGLKFEYVNEKDRSRAVVFCKKEKRKKHSEESNKRKSQALMGKNNPNYGKKMSDEAKENLRKLWSKPIKCIETGQIFNSAKEASSILKINSVSIGKVCNGKAKTAGGFTFKFISKKNKKHLDIKA